jgi:transposase
MRPKGTPAELERRRSRALQLLESGESPSTIARILGVTSSSLHRWRRMARQPDGLIAKPAIGAKRRLSDAQLCVLERLLLQGASTHGYPNELWTAARVTQVIQRHFGIEYHPKHVLKILKLRLQWTSHKPQVRARERNDKEIERWKADEFPRILREAWRRKAHVAFLDESGFMLTPLVRRTLGPRGQRILLRAWEKHSRISVISCVTLSPQAMHVGLYFRLLVNKNAHGEDIRDFLDYLTHRVPGEWTVVWDRHKIHSRSSVVKQWLVKHPYVVVEDLPPYDPQNNPDEWVWSWAKYGKLCNLCPTDLEELYNYVLKALEDLKRDHYMLASFVMDAGVPLGLL